MTTKGGTSVRQAPDTGPGRGRTARRYRGGDRLGWDRLGRDRLGRDRLGRNRLGRDRLGGTDSDGTDSDGLASEQNFMMGDEDDVTWPPKMPV